MGFEIAAGLERTRETLAAAGRDPSDVTIVGVTKGHGIDAIEAALEAGLVDLGENYAEDLVAKAELAEARGWNVRWHWLGRIQTNKLARLVPHVALWQSVDSASHAVALAKREPDTKVLIQVNLTGAPGRTGTAPGDVGTVVGAAREAGLLVCGLMGVGPAPDVELSASAQEQASAAAFRELVRAADLLQLPVRSIGMSADLFAAALAGTTMVRLGEALFGARSA